ncbi:MAG: Lrp/AsnC ligand binding domain-containing protein [Caulobacteraceae bacterium]|nr:Lrp/AsnC ligand binding domain-containing protein [Caulobacter sp.]
MTDAPPPFRARTIFVQIKCAPGEAYDVAARLADTVEPTPEVWSTSGAFDLLAKFPLGEGRDPGRFVTEAVQRLPGVRDTYTIIGFNAFTPDRDPG